MSSRRVAAALSVTAAALFVTTAVSAQTLLGTKGPNALLGTKAADRLKGKGGNDLLRGKAGADFLSGGKGRDTLVGGRGADRISGGPGNDVIKASDGRADRRVDGGGGANTCVIDIPLDLAATANCGSIQQGAVPGGGGGGGAGTGLNVTTAQGLGCLPLVGCAFTITGNGADDLVGTVTSGGAVTSVANVAVNAVVTGTWVATGVYNCDASGGDGYLVVTIGTKSTPHVPVDC